LAGSLVLALGLVGCSRPATREWTAQDHDVEPTAPGSPSPAPTRALTPAERGAALIDAAWSANCASCHGPDGRGDGPTGPMVKAPDLTRRELLDKATDDDLATVVKTGRGKMPKFDLPPEVVLGLVKRIRGRGAR
jgi:mono/diheme cytochrome c family protein